MIGKELITKEMVLAILKKHGPLGSEEICELIEGARIHTIRRKIVQLRKPENKQIYLARWDPQEFTLVGARIPIYAIGNKEDVAKPKPLSRAKIAARHREKHKALLSIKEKQTKYQKLGVWAGLI